MASSDIDQIVEVHLKSFPGFFLTFLGRDFLRLLYTGVQEDPGGIVLVACTNGLLQGFVAGVTQQSGFYRRLIQKHKWAFARAALGAMASRPSIARRLLRALRRPADANDASARACLLSIAVRPEAEGRGIGSSLIDAFRRELVGRHVTAVCLTTDRDHNERANRFYQDAGFRHARGYLTPEGRPMSEYLLLLGRE